MKLASVFRRFISGRFLKYQLYFQPHRCLSSSSTTPDDSKYDMVIAGGGIVGSTLACAITQSPILRNHRILLLESTSAKTILQSPSPEYSNRVSTINPSNIEFFSQLGIWEDIRKVRAQPVKMMQVWESCSDSYISYDNDQMRKEVAFVIENNVIVNTLAKHLQHSDNVNVLYGARAKSYTLPVPDSASLVEIELEDGTKYETSLLIGADGPGSLVRRTMNVKYVGWSYKQEAIVATLELSETTDNTVAWQRFLPTGPVAILPLSNTLSSLVWTNTPENCRHLLSLHQDEFVDALNDALWSDKHRMNWMDRVLSGTGQFLKALGSNSSARQLPPSIQSLKNNSRAAFPLALGHASNYVGERVVLIGDAAHRVHPLAGLGVNLGLGDVMELVRTLESACYNGEDIANGSYLREYETKRQRHVVPTMAAIDGLHRLYTTKMPLVVLLRSVGLQVTDSCPMLKQRIISHASA